MHRSKLDMDEHILLNFDKERVLSSYKEWKKLRLEMALLVSALHDFFHKRFLAGR